MFRCANLPLFFLLAGCQGVSTVPSARDTQEYTRIMDVQRLAAAAARDDQRIRRGQEVFLHGPCAMCHTVRGTLAMSRVGPDLTHVASRTTLASGTLPNTRGHMAGWILNPHNLKPGTRMPPTLLPSEDLQALLAFLESLK